MLDQLQTVADSAIDLLAFVFYRKLGEPEFWAGAIFLFALFLLHMHRQGFRPSWPRRLVEGTATNIGFFLSNILFAPAVYLAAGAVESLYDRLDVPHIPTSVWQNLPTWVLVPIAIFAYDFANYWSHRLMHMRWLWPVHAIHHSDPDVTGLTAYRIHFLEVLIMLVSYTLLLSWLGFPQDVLGYSAAVLSLHVIYVHLDLDWDHGWLRHVVASPRFHRWHHADVPAAYGKNLANHFPVFDLVFGTYYVPGCCKATMGARDVPQNDLVRLLLFPFAQWSTMLGRSILSKGRGVLEKIGVLEPAEDRLARAATGAALVDQPPLSMQRPDRA